MRTENWPKCLAVLSYCNASVRANKNAPFEFRIIHMALVLKNSFFIKN